MLPPKPLIVPPVITASPPPAPPVMRNYQAVCGRGGSYPHGAKGSLPYFPFTAVYFIDFGRWGHHEYYNERYYSLDLSAWTIETKIGFSLFYQQADYERHLGWTTGPKIDIATLNGKRPYWG